MVRTVALEEWPRLWKSFNLVFKARSPFGQPFKDEGWERVILFPTDGFCLTKAQFEALRDASESLGENGWYVSQVEASDSFTKSGLGRGHWEMSAGTSYKVYQREPLILENALYSMKGSWGVLISHEDHAVVGGIPPFMRRFKALYSNHEDDLVGFLQYWDEVARRGIDTRWVNELIGVKR